MSSYGKSFYLSGTEQDIINLCVKKRLQIKETQLENA